jgi:hypothetical protein
MSHINEGAPKDGDFHGWLRPSQGQEPAEISRVRGRRCGTQAGLSRRDRSRRELRPNPIDSDTSLSQTRWRSGLEPPAS